MASFAATSCSKVEPHLKAIWQEFRKQGITDDLAIIEHIAFLLLAQTLDPENTAKPLIQDIRFTQVVDSVKHQLIGRLKPPSSELIPTAITTLSFDTARNVSYLIKQAVEQIAPSQLLNECLLFRLTDMLPGGRYATPRHIAHTMARLAQLKPGETLLDPACGSGGLLVENADLKLRVTGIEISPNWARIAWANAILHELPEPDIRIGNTFAVFSDPGAEPKFDCILMNPPFGEVIDQQLIDRSLGSSTTVRFTGKSETLFTIKTHPMLQPGGRMVVLLPAGVLFSNASSDHALREVLLEDGKIHAIVTLPKDALQPFTGIQTHLLIIRQVPAAAETVWFYQVSHDGFSSGRNRRPEPEKSELPRLEATVLTQSNVLADANGQPLIKAHDIRVDSELVGYHLTRQGNGKLTVSCLNQTGRPASSLLVTLDQPSDSVCTLLQHGTQYSGLRQNRAINITLTETTTVAGTYKLDYEGLDDMQFVLKARSARLERKGRLLIEFKVQSRRDRSGPALLIVDVDGVLVSPLFTVSSLDQLPKPLRVPTAGVFPLEHENGYASGHLIIFSRSSLEAVPLASSDGQEVYLAELPDARLLLWPDEAKRLTRIEVTTSVTTFVGESFHHSVAVDPAGKWFGVQVPTDEIILKHGALLQPTEYFPKEIAPQQQRSPADLLGNIKRKHQQLDRHIDYLLGIVELRPIATAKIPPEIAAGLQPFGTLNEIQQAVWDTIQLQVEVHSPAASETYIAPKPFRVEDIRGTYPAADAQRALELFECMGLIVRVTIDEAPYYRLVTQSDLVRMEAAP